MDIEVNALLQDAAKNLRDASVVEEGIAAQQVRAQISTAQSNLAIALEVSKIRRMLQERAR